MFMPHSFFAIHYLRYKEGFPKGMVLWVVHPVGGIHGQDSRLFLFYDQTSPPVGMLAPETKFSMVSPGHSVMFINMRKYIALGEECLSGSILRSDTGQDPLLMLNNRIAVVVSSGWRFNSYFWSILFPLANGNSINEYSEF